MYIITLFYLLSFCFSAFAETYQYQLKGSYKVKFLKDRPVEFNLQWSEEKGKMTGIYSDNFFVDSTELHGHQEASGRNFTVKLPQDKNGVRTISLLTSNLSPKEKKINIPVSIITRDRHGNPLTNSKIESEVSTIPLVVQKQEEQSCQEGFGALSGYCGIYSGLIAEDEDRRNRCNLLYADAVRLELAIDSTLVLYMGQVDELLNTPRHVIGRIPVNPTNTKVDVMSRICRPMMGVNSSGNTCKQLSLRGEFTSDGVRKHFSGAYTIKEENTNNQCVYTLSMDLGG